MLQPTVLKFCMMVHTSWKCLLTFWRRYRQGVLKIQNVRPLKSEYLENGKSQRYMSIRAYHQLYGSLLKCMAWEFPIRKIYIHNFYVHIFSASLTLKLYNSNGSRIKTEAYTICKARQMLLVKSFLKMYTTGRQPPQSWLWVWSIHGLGWVGSEFLIFGGLGWVGWRLDCVIFLTS